MKVPLDTKKLNFQQLQAFVEVARRLSFTRAADALCVTQPTLSGLIRQLEQALGVSLFDRGTRHVHLTETGKKLLPSARRLMAEAQVFAQSFEDQFSPMRQLVRLSALPSELGADLIRLFRQRNPQARLEVRDRMTDQALGWLRQGLVDLAILTHVDPLVEFDVVPIGQQRIAVLMPETHPLAQQSQVACAQLLPEPLLAPNSETAMARYSMEILHAHGFNFAKLSRVPDVLYAAALVHAGLGLALMSEGSSRLLAIPGLVARPLMDPEIMRPIVMVRCKGKELTPAAEMLWEMACETASPGQLSEK